MPRCVRLHHRGYMRSRRSGTGVHCPMVEDSSQLEEALRQLIGMPRGWQVEIVHFERGRLGEFGRYELALVRNGHRFLSTLVDGQEDPDWVVRDGISLGFDGAVPAALRGSLLDRFRRHRPPTGVLDWVREQASKGVGQSAQKTGRPNTFEQANQHFASSGQDLYHHAESNQRGVHGIMRLGFHCNQDCDFCWQGRQWPEATQPWQTRMEELGARGVTSLVITGGEPTLYKELPDVVQDGHKRGWRTVLQTNGIGFSNPRLMARLVDAGLDGAFISFHSADAEISDEITNSPNTWVRTVAGVRAALDAGIQLRLNCVVDKRNVDTLPDHARFIRDTFGDEVGVDYSDMSPTYDPANYRKLAVPFSRTRGPLVAASAILLDAGIAVSCSSGCGFPPCLLSDEPRLLAELTQSFLNYELEGRDNRYVACQTCSWADRCRGPRNNYVALFGEDGLRPISP